MYAISINYSRTYLQLSVRAVFTKDTSVNNDSRIKRLTVLFKSEFSVKKQLTMKNIGKHTL